MSSVRAYLNSTIKAVHPEKHDGTCIAEIQLGHDDSKPIVGSADYDSNAPVVLVEFSRKTSMTHMGRGGTYRYDTPMEVLGGFSPGERKSIQYLKVQTLGDGTVKALEVRAGAMSS
jgi:hypothetical protein